jgi:hypothetical protein
MQKHVLRLVGEGPWKVTFGTCVLLTFCLFIFSAMLDSTPMTKIFLKEEIRRNLTIKPSFVTGIARPASFPQEEVKP